MNLDLVRQLIFDEREKQQLTQDVVAKRAGVGQGVISKIEDLKQPLTELRARVLFTVIEKGLGLQISDFFLQIERQTEGDSTALRQRDRTHPPQHQPGQSREAVDGARASVRSDPEVLREVLYDFAEVLSEAAKRIPTSAHQRPAGANTRGPGRAARRGGTRRKKTG